MKYINNIRVYSFNASGTASILIHTNVLCFGGLEMRAETVSCRRLNKGEWTPCHAIHRPAKPPSVFCMYIMKSREIANANKNPKTFTLTLSARHRPTEWPCCRLLAAQKAHNWWPRIPPYSPLRCVVYIPQYILLSEPHRGTVILRSRRDSETKQPSLIGRSTDHDYIYDDDYVDIQDILAHPRAKEAFHWPRRLLLTIVSLSEVDSGILLTLLIPNAIPTNTMCNLKVSHSWTANESSHPAIHPKLLLPYIIRLLISPRGDILIHSHP